MTTYLVRLFGNSEFSAIPWFHYNAEPTIAVSMRFFAFRGMLNIPQFYTVKTKGGEQD